MIINDVRCKSSRPVPSTLQLVGQVETEMHSLTDDVRHEQSIPLETAQKLIYVIRDFALAEENAEAGH